MPGANHRGRSAKQVMLSRDLRSDNIADAFPVPKSVNKVPAHGGTIGSAGPVVAGGMMFVGSGYGFGGNDKNGNVLLAFSAE